ncbi:kinase-like domain-containing protein [Syncephalis fuscata]|nr:kinase-like domain-containing protein [Syncephalis fuscata]
MHNIQVFVGTIACCLLALTNKSTVQAVGGYITADRFIDAAVGKPGALSQPTLTIRQWLHCDKSICLAKATWKQTIRFLKCESDKGFVSSESRAFNKILQLDNAARNLNLNGKDNVLHPIDEFKVTKGNCYVYEYIDGVSLLKFFENKNSQFKLTYSQSILIQTLQGLSYLRRAGLTHNDISSSNIMVTKRFGSSNIQVKVIDYDNVYELPASLSSGSANKLKYDAFDTASTVYELLTAWQKYISEAQKNIDAMSKWKLQLNRMILKPTSNRLFDSTNVNYANYLIPLISDIMMLIPDTKRNCLTADQFLAQKMNAKTNTPVKQQNSQLSGLANNQASSPINAF